jgi:predicted type IV restriction endonuclease
MSRTGSLNSCVTEDDIKQMIEEANLKNSKRIKFDEFKTIFIKKEAEVQATIRAAK